MEGKFYVVYQHALLKDGIDGFYPHSTYDTQDDAARSIPDDGIPYAVIRNIKERPFWEVLEYYPYKMKHVREYENQKTH